MPRIIQQVIHFDVSPGDVYGALTQSEEFAKFTDQPAHISQEAGGEFRGFDGMISGRNLELVPDRRIVQAWRVSQWPEGAFSLVRFDLKQSNSGTDVTLTHSGYPDDTHEHLEAGWHKMYWEPLRVFLAK